MPSQVSARVARLRVPIGFACGVFVWWLARPTVSTLVAGGAMALVGEALRVWAAGHLVKSREVTSSGPYRWFAHPLYVGSSIMGVGLAIGSNRVSAALLVMVYLGVTITAAIRAEEAFLRRTFGGEYDAYRRGGSDRAAGGVAGPGAPQIDAMRERQEDRRFSLKQALANREQRAIAGWLMAMSLLALKLVI